MTINVVWLCAALLYAAGVCLSYGRTGEWRWRP